MDVMRTDAVMLAADLVLTVVFLKATVLLLPALALPSALRGRPPELRAGAWAALLAALLLLASTTAVAPWWSAPLLAFPGELFRGEHVAGTPAGAWLALAWAAGALYLAGRFALERLRLQRVADAAHPVCYAAWHRAAARAAADLGVRRAFDLSLTADVRGPLVFGVRRPHLLFPLAARGWSDDRVAAVIRHELAHVHRQDYLLLLGTELARALFWPNPLAWLLVRRLRAAQDAACDAAAVRGGIPAAEYAAHLLAIARDVRAARAAAPALPLVPAEGLGSRVDAVLATPTGPGRAPAVPALRLAALAATVALLLGGADPWSCIPAPGAVADTRSAEPAASVAGLEASPGPVIRTG